MKPISFFCGAIGVLASVFSATVGAEQLDDQSNLKPLLNYGGKEMHFDWPAIEIGTGEYAEGPTGVTVIKFKHKVWGAIDSRGGGPGTVNADFLRIGYEVPDLDAVVFSGGSWYGLENATAVNTAIKDDGVRTGHWDSVALTMGSIIYDFGSRRLNEIYPDKKLAQAAYRAAKPGVFRLGAAGAGRLAKTGEFFGCGAHSGQGAAYRQIGDLKIAVFTVVNAVGAVTKRDGTLAACFKQPGWPEDVTAHDLMQGIPESRSEDWPGKGKEDPLRKKGNTTISLVVVNQKLEQAFLERLAIQVQTSMSRAIQPYATVFDGDVLYAVSTGEIDPPEGDEELSAPDIGVVASELMWDAILSAVPEQPKHAVIDDSLTYTAKDLKPYSGDYTFSRFVTVKVWNTGGKLYAQATGERNAFAIGRNEATELRPVKKGVFTVPGRYPVTLDFTKKNTLTFNPGTWEQAAVKN